MERKPWNLKNQFTVAHIILEGSVCESFRKYLRKCSCRHTFFEKLWAVSQHFHFPDNFLILSKRLFLRVSHDSSVCFLMMTSVRIEQSYLEAMIFFITKTFKIKVHFGKIRLHHKRGRTFNVKGESKKFS